MINSLSSQYKIFETLKFPLIVLVVLIHSIPVSGEYKTMFLDIDLYKFISLNISRNLAYIAVPTFFVISGCLFFSNVIDWSKESYLMKIKSRTKSLLLPYLFWNLIFILIIIVKNILIKGIGGQYDFSYNLLNESSIIDLFWKIPINYPLWYVRDLMVMCAFSPLFFIFIKYLKHYALLILLIIFLFFVNFEEGNKIFFFSLGAYFGIFKKDVVIELKKFRCFTIPLSLLFAILSVLFFNKQDFVYYHRLYVFFAVLAIFPIFDFIINRLPSLYNFLKKQSQYTFFIYSIHVIYILDWVRGFLYKLPISNYEIGMIASYFGLTILIIVICISIYKFLHRLLPKKFVFLIGR